MSRREDNNIREKTKKPNRNQIKGIQIPNSNDLTIFNKGKSIPIAGYTKTHSLLEGLPNKPYKAIIGSKSVAKNKAIYTIFERKKPTLFKSNDKELKEFEFELSDDNTSIPKSINMSWILSFFKKNTFNNLKLKKLKLNSGLQQEKLAEILDVTPKTFKKYELGESKMKRHTQEHGLMLLCLLEHGKSAFGTLELFNQWLVRANSTLDSKAPIDYLNTISGVMYIDNRLTNIEYGDIA